MINKYDKSLFLLFYFMIRRKSIVINRHMIYAIEQLK